jgi:hypothetical protein
MITGNSPTELYDKLETIKSKNELLNAWMKTEI